jgi:serine/threonine-protein kinase RsbW
MSGDTVTLTVPAREEYARTVRMTAVAMVGRTGASVDQLDDIRIAVEEAFIYASELHEDEPQVTFEFRQEGDVFELKVGPLHGRAAEAGPGMSDRYARFLLESVCDEFETCDEAAGSYLRLSIRLELE